MPYFVDVCGEVKCHNPDSIPSCTKLLKRYHLKHEISENTISINSKLHVTVMFDKTGFRNHLLGNLKRHGEVKLSIIGEEPKNENPNRLL
jgi:hypothetical protein